MLTRKQHELLTFIQARLLAGGVSPSFEEMKDALDLKSKSGVHRLISALEERKFIRRLPNRARALEVLRMPEVAVAKPDNVVRGEFGRNSLPRAANDGIIDLPLHGRIAAGQPIEAFQGDEMLSVPAALLGSGDHYALEVSGDSMIDAGILSGDYALIQRCETARDGEIIVALVDNNDATLKYLRRERGMIKLDPANAMFEPQVYLPSRVKVQGKLVGLLRRYH
jgi:repressor LexA